MYKTWVGDPGWFRTMTRLTKGTLTFFCGKMGAGKSTLSQHIAAKEGAILLSEDEWLKTIYPEEINTLKDYIKYSSRLKLIMKRHVQNILNAGTSVVMDFPGNTEKQREWFKELFTECGCLHKLIYIEASDDLCIKRIAKRAKDKPERARFDTEDVFHQVTDYFQPPSEDKGFNIDVVCIENT